MEQMVKQLLDDGYTPDEIYISYCLIHWGASRLRRIIEKGVEADANNS